MRYLLDTNACVRHLKLVKEGRFQARLSQLDPPDIALCSIVKAELIYGALRSDRAVENRAVLKRFFSRFISLPFDDAAASAHGRIRSDLADRGLPIGPHDMMIAAIALVNNLTVVTHNTSEFSRVTGLRVEDWENGT